MKWIGPVLLTAVLSVPCLAAAQDNLEELTRQNEKLELQNAIRLKELDLEAKQAELEFQRCMHELELDARRAEIERLRYPMYGAGRQCGRGLAVLLLGMIAVRALATVWVYRDLQQDRTVSGLWIPLVLIGGLLALVAYVLTRLGNLQRAQTGPA